jgi:hypothetical protein
MKIFPVFVQATEESVQTAGLAFYPVIIGRTTSFLADLNINP